MKVAEQCLNISFCFGCERLRRTAKAELI